MVSHTWLWCVLSTAVARRCSVQCTIVSCTFPFITLGPTYGPDIDVKMSTQAGPDRAAIRVIGAPEHPCIRPHAILSRIAARPRPQTAGWMGGLCAMHDE